MTETSSSSSEQNEMLIIVQYWMFFEYKFHLLILEPCLSNFWWQIGNIIPKSKTETNE